MRRKHAVVTGGAGFLGSHLVERLLAADYDVLCVDNLLTGTTENIEHLGTDEAFHFHRSDVSKRLRVHGPVDLVLHLASPASPKDYLRLPIETMKAGSHGTLNALDLAKEKRARFVLASTSETYGDPEMHPQPETYWGHVNPVGPRAVYDEAKRFAEALTSAYRRSEGVNTAIVRIFNTYGPRMRADDGRVIPTFVTQALKGESMTVAGNGMQSRSVCYVDDLVEGLLRTLESDVAGPINLGNPEEHTVLSLAEVVRRLVGSDVPILFVPLPQDDPRLRRPDVSMALSALGWRPAVGLEDGLLRTIEWFRKRLNRVPDRVSPELQLIDPAPGLATA
jgi:nucleoside-diphosphate-sugar epimerase